MITRRHSQVVTGARTMEMLDHMLQGKRSCKNSLYRLDVVVNKNVLPIL